VDEQDIPLALGFQLSGETLGLIDAEVGKSNDCRKLFGPPSTEVTKDKGGDISAEGPGVMETAHGKSCTPWMMKYWLHDQIPMHISFPCDRPPPASLGRKIAGRYDVQISRAVKGFCL
jgi:hypothetical protein